MQNRSMESETSSQVNEQTKTKIDALMKAFSRIDKDMDSELTQSEIENFLNSNRPYGRQLNNNLAKKILESLDFDQNGTISVEEFIKGYVSFEVDLRETQLKYQTQLNEEKRNLQRNQEQCRKYQQEQLNNEGFCENAKITVTINEVNMHTKLEDLKSIGITIVYNDITRNTHFFSGDKDVTLNEKFEFKPKTRKDHFEFILKGIDYKNNEFDIGSKILNLEGTESQDEYKIEILISDLNDPNKIVANIQTLIFFYWSDFDHYTQQVKSNERKLDKIQKALNQLNEYCRDLNEIYDLPFSGEDPNRGKALNFRGGYEEPENQHTKNISDPNGIGSSNVMLKDNLLFSDEGEAPHPAIEAVEKQIKTVFRQEKVYWIIIIKIFAVLVFLLGFLCSFFRPDFPNALGGIIVLIICLIGFKNAKNEDILDSLKYMLYGVAALIGYDLIWVLMFLSNSWNGIDEYTGGNEDGILKFSMIITVINILLKLILEFGLWAQSKKIEKKNMETYK